MFCILSNLLINHNVKKKIKSFCKENRLNFNTNLFYEAPSINIIKTKHKLIEYTVLILKKNDLILNKPSYLLTCCDYLSKHSFLLRKKSTDTINFNELTEITNSIKNNKYKFSPLNADSMPKNIVIIKNRADIIKLKKTLTGKKLRNLIKIIKNKKFKFNKKYVIANKLTFNCVNLYDKLIQYAINTIIEALIIIKNLLPAELYSYNSQNTIPKFLLNWTKISYTTRFINKLDITDFFNSLNKKVIINAFNLLISKKDIVFFSILKKILMSGYTLKIAWISRNVGSKKIIKKTYNQNIYKIYQGTVLAPIASNLVNILILNDIKKILIKYNYGTWTRKNKIKHNVSNWIYKEKKKIIPDIKKLKKLRLKLIKTKSTVFTNQFGWANIFLYCDDLILVTHLNNKKNNELRNKIINIYKKYKLEVNKEKSKTVFCFRNNKGVSFLGFYLRGPNIIGRTKNNTIKSNCWASIDTIKIKNRFIMLGILTPRNLPTGTWDWSKNYKNLQIKLKNLKLLSSREIKLRNKLIYDPNYKILALLPLAALEASSILKYFYYKMLGLINYFKFCHFGSYLAYFVWILRTSCYKTLCAKFKVRTIKGLFRKFGKYLEELKINKNFFLKFNNLNKNISNIRISEVTKINDYIDYEKFFDNFNKIQINTQSDAIKLKCDLCDDISNNLELHHLKSVSKLWKKIKNLKFKYRNTKYLENNANEVFKLIHLSKNRKQIVVCKNCHVNIHNKTLKKSLLLKLAKF